MDEKQKRWNAAVARLEAFRDNAPTLVKEETIQQYHEIVVDLEAASGESFQQFRIPSERVKPRPAQVRARGYSGSPGSISYTKEKYCDSDYFRSQVDGLCRYLKTLEVR